MDSDDLAMDMDSDDLASVAKLKTLDGTTALTGSRKMAPCVLRNIIPDIALGESYTACSCKVVKPTEYH